MTIQEDQSQRKRVLVCGSTGYVGGRLVPRLLDRGYEVICLVRSPQKLEVHAWHGHPNLTVVQGELDPDDQVTIDRLGEAAINTDAAYYLIHSMISAGEDYASRDRKLAKAFADAMQQAACKRIIYLGGLGEWGPDLSRHLQSRREVAEILQQGTVPVTVFRAAMIIGSGSASFEILRYLVDRLPIMITPKWVRIETQPIAIRDVLRYLVETLDVPETVGRIIDIGGTDVLSYRDMMQMAAKAQGLSRRIILPVPVLTPKLSSGWISLVTPVSADIARPLAEGLRNRTVCKNDLATRLMPGTLFSVQQAIDAAFGKLHNREIETRWSTAGEMPGDPEWSGGAVFDDRRECVVDASPQDVFAAVCKIGGNYGYWGADWLWRLRGVMDQVIGGPGLRRGRRHPDVLSYGEAVDFWRVSGFIRDRQLTLRAEMKLPGDAELDFTIEPIKGEASKARLIQTARFRPLGLLGIAYWYAVLPMHFFVFPTMLRGISRDAVKQQEFNPS
jgi:uncharacterized protein YbjT (DUF2867 family)